MSSVRYVRQMVRDELALKTVLVEELTWEAQPEDLAQLQTLFSGNTRCLLRQQESYGGC